MLDSDKRPITNIFQTYVQTIFKDVLHLQTKVLADTGFDISSSNNFVIQLIIEDVGNIGTDILIPDTTSFEPIPEDILVSLNSSTNLGNITPVNNIPFGSYKLKQINIIYNDGVNIGVYDLGISDIMKAVYLQVPSVNLQDRLSTLLPPV